MVSPLTDTDTFPHLNVHLNRDIDSVVFGQVLRIVVFQQFADNLADVHGIPRASLGSVLWRTHAHAHRLLIRGNRQ